MEEFFVLTLSQHRRFGEIILPFFIEKREGDEFYKVKERLTLANIATHKNKLDDEKRTIIKLCEEYNDSTIVKLFAKKKISTKDYIQEVDDDYVANHIRPYIERRIQKIVEIILENNYLFYHKTLLNNIYETDRIYFADKSAQTIFNFEKTDEGTKYFLTIKYGDKEVNLTDKAGFIIANDPCVLVLENALFRFDDIDGKKLLPFFIKEFVFISKQAEKKYYSSFILSTLKKYNVNAKGFDVIEEDVNPVAQLSLENSISTEPVFVLRFKYGKHIIQRNHSFNKLVTINEKDQTFSYYKIERKLGYENNYISILGQLNLSTKDKISYITTAQNRETSFYDYINWININEKKLRENGFEIVQKYNQNEYYLSSFDLKIDVNNVEDWFDIRAYVFLNGHKIPFLAFKKNISKGIREYVLPDGEIFILPEEWFSRYKDLFSFADNEEEGIKLKKQHFTVLQEVLEGIDKEKYKKLANIEIKKTDEKIPEGVKAQLRPYQAEGFSWMHNLQKNNFGICLADDMGLGKTLQTLTLLKASIDSKRLQSNETPVAGQNQQLSLFDAPQEPVRTKAKPTLIITPTSLVHNWLNEIKKFVPDVTVGSYVGTNRPPFEVLYNKYEAIVTSYGILRNDIEEITKADFFYCILDESQTIKNHESKTYQAVLQVEAEHRIVLTGTPIENSLSDLWSQMNFLNRGLLGNFQFFKNEFLSPIESNNDEVQRDKLKQLIQPFILRRTKNQVAQDLPELNEHIVFCDMSESQEKYYETEKSKIRNNILDNINQHGIEKSSFIILQALTKLRQIANHPVLVDDTFNKDSGKFDDVVRKLDNLKNEGHKVLIFSSFVKHLDLLANYFDENNYNYSSLTGSTTNREKVVEDFQTDKNIHFFLISLKAGGVGLNLTAADYVFILDPWWNPAAELQAIARAHRMGQKNNVFVYRFISNGTIEEKIVSLQKKKSNLADTFVNDNNPFKGMDKKTVMDLIG